jgi:PAS domain S-box-containing protein
MTREKRGTVIYRNLIDRLPVGVYRTTRDGRLEFANAALADLFGYDRVEELLQVDVRELYVDPSERENAIAEADRGVVHGPLVHRFRRRDGSTFWARIRPRAVRDETGRTVGWEGIIEDVTEEYQLREALALSESRFRAAFENSPWPMILVGPDLGLLAANDAAVALAGVDRESLLATPPDSFVSPEEFEATLEQVAAMISGESDSYVATVHPEGPDGDRRTLMLSATAVRNPDGTLNSIVYQVVDVTDRERVREQLEALVRAKEDLVMSVSHELRTPLTSIVGLARELVERWEVFDEEERRDLVELVASQGEDMAALVEDLLVAARSEVGMVSIHPEVLDLGVELADVVGCWTSRAEVRFEPPAEPIYVLADAHRFRQILRNLLSNAVKYGKEPILVRVEGRDDRVEVSVRDMGEALPETQREVIFDPYYRASTAAAPPGSVGLGLAVSRNLARLMGGDLEYRVTDGTSDFVLTLPGAK